MNEAELIKSHPFSRGLFEAHIQQLVPCARRAQFEEGTFVFRDGGEADALYLILRGRVTLEQHVPGRGALQLETLTKGDLLGFSWLFPGGHWTLDARAVEPTEALVMDAHCLHAQMDGDPTLGLALAKYLIHQLYQRLERVRLQRLDVYRAGP